MPGILTEFDWPTFAGPLTGAVRQLAWHLTPISIGTRSMSFSLPASHQHLANPFAMNPLQEQIGLGLKVVVAIER